MAKKISRQLAMQRKHKELGLCRLCSEPAKAGYVHCEKHWKSATERNRIHTGAVRRYLPKATWDAVDWALPPEKIAKKLKQKLSAVKSQIRMRFTIVKTVVPKVLKTNGRVAKDAKPATAAARRGRV